MERCPVYGNAYGITHFFPGPPTTQFAGATKWPMPAGFAPPRSGGLERVGERSSDIKSSDNFSS